jgi:hypothetical protein
MNSQTIWIKISEIQRKNGELALDLAFYTKKTP